MFTFCEFYHCFFLGVDEVLNEVPFVVDKTSKMSCSGPVSRSKLEGSSVPGT